jgi:hypothetical protein
LIVTSIIPILISSEAHANSEEEAASSTDASVSSEDRTSESRSKSSSDDEADEPGPVSVSGHAMFRYTWALDPDDDNGTEIYNLRLYLERSFEGVRWRFDGSNVVDRVEWILHRYS